VRIDEPIARAVLDLADTDGSPIMAVPVAFSYQTQQRMAAQGALSVELCQRARERRQRTRKDSSASDAAPSTPSKGLPEGWVHQKDPSGR
jgi:hypothetical protein